MGRIPEFFCFPKDPITDCDVLVDLLSTMVLRGYIESGVSGINFRYLNNQQMNQLFEGTLEAFPYYTGDMIKKSIKICYKSDAWFGISTEARNNFLVDLRNRIDEMVEKGYVDEVE